MARPIEATPILKGRDAEAFLCQMEVREPVSAERLTWLQSVATESKSAEAKKK
jgi:hypothetical protein